MTLTLDNTLPSQDPAELTFQLRLFDLEIVLRTADLSLKAIIKCLRQVLIRNHPRNSSRTSTQLHDRHCYSKTLSAIFHSLIEHVAL